MSKLGKSISIILLSLAFTMASAQDWVEESNEYTTVILKAQSQFVPEGASSLGLTEFDDSIMDLGPDLFARTTAVDQALVKQTGEWLSTSEDPKVIQDLLPRWIAAEKDWEQLRAEKIEKNTEKASEWEIYQSKKYIDLSKFKVHRLAKVQSA